MLVGGGWCAKGRVSDGLEFAARWRHWKFYPLMSVLGDEMQIDVISLAQRLPKGGISVEGGARGKGELVFSPSVKERWKPGLFLRK